ncbi:MAG: SsrA-binding protein SmpB [Bacteroidota bacterium]
MAEKGRNQTVISNRKASYEYHIEDRFEAGISLRGTEVKSLRAGKASLQEAFCYIKKEEVFVKNMNIAEYDKGSYNNHEPMRERKLLLRKKELKKIKKQLNEKGYTLIPLKVYFNKRNFAKMEIGLAKGKKIHDKRSDIKKKDTQRDLDRAMKNY